MNKRQKALAATIAYLAGISYAIHLGLDKDPQMIVSILAIIGAVTVSYNLVVGAVILISKIFQKDV